MIMKLQNSETKSHLLQRLHRIEGQVRGVGSMLESDRECREIIQQVTAIQSALLGFRELLLEEYALSCLLPAEDTPLDRRAQEQTLREFIHMVNKT
jgi:CsoR family transcriptional regulator, copper-sensing transcriptional repressor